MHVNPLIADGRGALFKDYLINLVLPKNKKNKENCKN